MLLARVSRRPRYRSCLIYYQSPKWIVPRRDRPTVILHLGTCAHHLRVLAVHVLTSSVTGQGLQMVPTKMLWHILHSACLFQLIEVIYLHFGQVPGRPYQEEGFQFEAPASTGTRHRVRYF